MVEITSRYLKFAEGYYVKNGKQTGEVTSIKAALRILIRLYGRTLANDFGPLSLKAVREAMIEAGHSRGYVNNNINRIRRMFRWAVSEELIAVTVYQSLAALPGLKKGKSAAVEHDSIMPVENEVALNRSEAQYRVLQQSYKAEGRSRRLKSVNRKVVTMNRPWVALRR